jgi:hypothetical protein
MLSRRSLLAKFLNLVAFMGGSVFAYPGLIAPLARGRPVRRENCPFVLLLKTDLAKEQAQTSFVTPIARTGICPLCHEMIVIEGRDDVEFSTRV